MYKLYSIFHQYVMDMHNPSPKFAPLPLEGHSSDLPRNYTAAVAMVKQMKNDTWIDAKTRAVVVDATVYNNNLHLYTVIRFLMEIPASSGITPSTSFHPTRLGILAWETSKFDTLFFVSEIYLVLFLVFFTLETVYHWSSKSKKDKRPAQLYVDIVVYTLLWVVIVLELLILLVTSFERRKGEDEFHFDMIGSALINWQNLFLAVAVLSCFIKVLHHFQK